MTTQIEEKKMSGRELKQHYARAMSYLDYNYAYFLTEVIRIGRPKWTTAIPTAGVALTEKKDLLGKHNGEYDLLFIFNPHFASTLSVDEFAFVLAHEAFHVVLNHLKVSNQYYDVDRRTELSDKLKRNERLDKDELKDWFTFKQIEAKLNIAMDCVINDYLVNNGLKMFMVDNPEKPGEKIGGGCTGEKFIGENAAYLTVRDVYERLPEQPSGEGGGEGEGEGSGTPGEASDGRGGQAMDDHSWIFDPNAAEEMADAIDKMNDELEKQGKGAPVDVKDKKEEEETGTTKGQDKLSQSMRHGTEEGNIREFQEQLGVEMAWVKLLKEIDPDIFKEPGIGPPPQASWHQRRRKLGAYELRDTNLPVYRDNRRKEKRSNFKPAIVLALDYSGSIGPTDADRFATLAKSIPTERIKIFACTFTTHYREFDLENPHGGGSGGTDFNAIADYIDDIVKPQLQGKGDYPKAVIVITDGHAPFDRRPEGQEADSWLWLLSPDDGGHNHYDASMNIGRRAALDEYIA